MIRRRREIKVNVIDTKKNIAVGISLPFNGSSVFNQTFTTKDQVKTNLINFFLTNPGERPFNPLFGAGLRSLLFEQLSLGGYEELREVIQAQIGKFFPSITVISLEFTPIPDDNSILIKLEYKFNQQDDTLVIQVQ